MARHSWSDIRAAADPETLARAEAKTRRMLEEMPLHELRQARHMTQAHIAETLGTSQANVSKMERRTDLYLSTLRRYVEAMGGELDIRARFPDGEVRIDQLGELSSERSAPRSRG